MKKELFIFKLSMLLVWITFLAILLFSFLSISNTSNINSNGMNIVLYLLLLIFYISFVPFTIILFNINKLLNSKNIDKMCDKSSIKSIDVMIKYSKIMSVLHFISIPLFYIVGEVDDAPGVIIVSLVLFIFPILLLTISSFFKKVILLKNKE